jgi:hypothetical protein
VGGALRQVGGWFASALATVREFFNTPNRAETPPLIDAKTPAAGPEPLFGVSQAVADTKPVALDRISMPERRGTLTDAGAPLLLLAAIGVGAAIVIGVIFAVDAAGGDGASPGIVGDVTETPRTTLIPAASKTPQTGEASPTRSPSPTPSASPSATPSPTPAPATPPLPQGDVAAALWANTADSWWFGELTGDVARYEEGQVVPLMIQWEGAAWETYWVRITYDCSAPGALGAIDYLSGVQGWGADIVYADYGPADDSPSSAIVVPETWGFTQDDQNPGQLSLYAAQFPVTPMAPLPGGECPGQRTMSLPVLAYGGKITLLASVHLGAASVYGQGKGAAGATSALSAVVSVDGVGAAAVSLDPSAIANAEH